MAHSFPLDLATFFDTLCPLSTTFDLMETVKANRTQGGQTVRSDAADRLWFGTINLRPRKPVLVDDLMTMIRVLQDSRASFLIYPTHRPQARQESSVAIPTGKINSLPTNKRLITLKDLPAGFKITVGDFLSFLYLTNPVRYGFHQAVESITANGSGVTGQFEVIPPIRPGATVDTNVRLAKPYLRAQMVPGSLVVQPHPIRYLTEGASFSWVQVLVP